MALKHLEHDGDENFEGLSKRTKVKADAFRIKNAQKSDEEILEEQQIEYMNPNNEDLWDSVDLDL